MTNADWIALIVAIFMILLVGGGGWWAHHHEKHRKLYGDGRWDKPNDRA